MARVPRDARSIRISAVESHLLDPGQLASVLDSGQRLLAFYHDLWHGFSSKVSNVHLVLLPLDRVGSEQGVSGTKVVVGHFEQDTKRGPLRSRPVVLKVNPRTPTTRLPRRGPDKLRSEMNRARAIASYATKHPEVFALPIHFDGPGHGRKYSVLWSPFQSSKPFPHASRGTLPLVYELCQVLRGYTRRGHVIYPPAGRPHLADLSLTSVYGYLRPFHASLGAAENSVREAGVLEQYKEWVGDFRTRWGRMWQKAWGNHTQKECSDGMCVEGRGHRWVNPCWVLHKLRDVKARLRFGAIHGDLHPRNVVFNADNEVRIIDFGGASALDHVAKDFVLMECNLRFMLLRADLACETLARMARCEPFGWPLPNTDDKYLDERTAMISSLREVARERLAHRNVNWDLEYIVPLFLVAFGLLDPVLHARCDNQVAARLTVLSLATYIAEAVLA